MRCAFCLLEGKKASYQDVAVVGGYSLCEVHLKEWALTEHTTPAEWLIERSHEYQDEWYRKGAELAAVEDLTDDPELQESIIRMREEPSSKPWRDVLKDEKVEEFIEEISEVVSDAEVEAEIDNQSTTESTTDEVEEFIEEISEAVSDPEIEEKILPRRSRHSYYCTKCETHHRKKSKIGKRHRKHEGERSDD